MKRWIRFCVFLGCCLMAVILTGEMHAKASTFTDNENGTVTLSYQNSTGVKMKLLVQVSATGYRQTYDLCEGQNELVIPLTNGNESYTLKLCKQIEGTRYSTVETETVSLELDNENEVYLYTNVIVEYVLSDKAIKKASSLTKKCVTEEEVVEKLTKYVIENYSYDYDKAKEISSGTLTQYIPDIQDVYRNKLGICYDYSVLLAAMLRTQGIEVKVVTGYCSNVNGYHAWNQVHDSESGKWYTIDATYDSCYYNAGKTYSIDKKEEDYSTLKYIY